MSDLISRKEVYDEWYKFMNDALERIQSIESKKGRWIRNDNGTYSCNVCQSWIPEEQHYYARYCLHCGTKKDGVR